MRPWKIVAVVNLALVVGVGWGWVRWGRSDEGLAREPAVAPATAPGREREWRVRGVVRARVPEIGAIVLSHEEIPGFMPGMTMGFRLASPKIGEAVSAGDEVRFTLRGRPPDVVVTAIEKRP